MTTDRYSLDEIRDFWTRQIRQHGQSVAASWSDRYAVEMEIREVLRSLGDGDVILDIGCANGYSTVRFAAERRVRIRGVDYIPEMIDAARARLAALPSPLLGQVEFGVDDVLALMAQDAAYDKVVMVRVLINLREWSEQLKALGECARVLKPGGLLILSEATLQGWRRLNALRAEWGFPHIPMPPFNEYIDQDRLLSEVRELFEIVEVHDFSSTYFVGTRVLKPLIAKVLHAPVDVADPDMEWNRWFSMLPAWGDYGTQRSFILRRR